MRQPDKHGLFYGGAAYLYGRSGWLLFAPARCACGRGASVVDLTFPSFRWRARLGTSNPNHTSFPKRVASGLSNPKFAQSLARDIANFGFGTLGGVRP